MVIYIICIIGWNKYFVVNGLHGDVYNVVCVNDQKTEVIHSYKSPKKSCTKPVCLIENVVKAFELYPTLIFPCKFLSLPKYSNVSIL
jgi:hypothetical protein